LIKQFLVREREIVNLKKGAYRMRKNLVVAMVMALFALLSITSGAYSASVSLSEPLNGTTTSNPFQEVYYVFTDASDVDPSTILLTVTIDGVPETYHYMMPELTWDPSRLYFIPSVAFEDGDIVELELVAETFSGEPVDGCPLTSTFSVDMSGPYVLRFAPEYVVIDTLGTLAPPVFTERNIPFEMEITDDYGEINPHSVRVQLTSASYTHTLTYSGTYRFYWVETDSSVIISFYPDSVGILWEAEDHITVRIVSAEDMPDYGEANTLQGSELNEFEFFISATGPTAEYIFPEDSSFTSCTDLEPVLHIHDVDGVLADSTHPITIDVNGIEFSYPADENLTWDETTGMLTYHPLSPYPDGSAITVSLLEAYDSLGNPVEPEGMISWTFFVDRTPPVVDLMSNWPPNGYTTMNRLEHISFRTYDIFGDAIRPVDSDNIHVIIQKSDGTRYEYFSVGSLIPEYDSVPEILWDGYTWEFAPESLGISWNPGDTIYVSIYEVRDNIDYCAPNITYVGPFVWEFYVASGPQVEIVQPLPRSTSNCPDQVVHLILHDEDGIDPASVLLEVNGTVYDTGYIYEVCDTFWYGVECDTIHPLLVLDSIVYFRSPVPFENHEEVEVSLLSAADIHGNQFEGRPLSWSFIMDMDPPIPGNPFPADGAYFNAHDISLEIYDSLSHDVYLDNMMVVINNAYRYIYPGNMLWWDPVAERLHFYPDSTDMPLVDGEVLNICVYNISDNPTHHDCTVYGNLYDGPYCWSFTYDESPPVVGDVVPATGTFSACDTQQLSIEITDPAGVDPSSIMLVVNGHLYTTSSPYLDYDGTYLVFTPPEAYTTSGTVVNWAVIQMADLAGNLIDGTPATGHFTVDLAPPVVASTFPEDGEFVTHPIDHISFDVYDVLSDVNWSSASFTVTVTTDDVPEVFEIPAGSEAIDFYGNTVLLNLEAAGIAFTLGGQEVEVNFTIADNPDYACDEANILEETLNFTIDPGWKVDFVVWDTLVDISCTFDTIWGIDGFGDSFVVAIDTTCDTTITEAWTPILTFGATYEGTPGYDPGLDVEAPPSGPGPGPSQPAFVIDGGMRLTSDYRGLMDETFEWMLACGDEAGTLIWFPDEIPDGINLVMNGYLDMRTTDHYDYNAGDVILINMYRDIISLNAGWNLVSVPVEPIDPSVDAVFVEPIVSILPEEMRPAWREIIKGSIWHYNPTLRRYEPVVNVEPGKGYFILSPVITSSHTETVIEDTETTYVEVIDTIFDGNISFTVPGAPVMTFTERLTRGWNTLGSVYNFGGVPISDWTIDPEGSLTGGLLFSYNTETCGYDRETGVRAGIGYWIFVMPPYGFDYADVTIDAGILTKSLPVASTIETPSWVANISISSDDRTKTLTVGLDENATDSYDASFDLPMPPALPGAFDACILENDELGRYSVSVKKEGPWTLCINSAAVVQSDAELYILVDNRWTNIQVPVSVPAGEYLLRAMAESSAIPTEFALLPNVPNPFNPATEIAFNLPNECRVELSIYNAIGSKVRTLVDETLPGGHHTVVWDGRDNTGKPVPTGVYFYRLTSDEFTSTRKMLLLK